MKSIIRLFVCSNADIEGRGEIGLVHIAIDMRNEYFFFCEVLNETVQGIASLSIGLPLGLYYHLRRQEANGDYIF